MQYHLIIQDKQYTVEIGAVDNGSVAVSVNDEVYQVVMNNPNRLLSGSGAPNPVTVVSASSPVAVVPRRVPVTAAPATAPAAAAPASGVGVVKAPIPGLILDIMVQVGEAVTVGQTVATMEAMKMENHICCSVSGSVKEIRAAKGAAVAAGDVIMAIG